MGHAHHHLYTKQIAEPFPASTLPATFQMTDTPMRRFGFGLLAVLGLLLVLPAPAATQTDPGPRTDSQTFMVRICNRHSNQVFVSLIIRPDVNRPQDWVIRGWWRIAGQQCVDAARSLYGYIYAYAENATDGSWPPADDAHEDAIDMCVEYPGPFLRVRTSVLFGVQF